MKNLKIFCLLILIFTPVIKGQILQPGDGVRISFYNITDPVVGDFYIETDDNIHLPYIGFINTENKEFTVIKNEIIETGTLLLI